MIRLGRAVGWAISALLVACSGGREAPSPDRPIRFEAATDIVTVSPQTDKRGRPKSETEELAGHAVAVLDANLDGRLDVVIVNGNPYYFVSLNRGENADGMLRFDTQAVYIGVEEDGKTNVPRSIHSHDFDNDGTLDLYLCNAGKGTLKARSWKDLERIHDPSNLVDRGLFREARYRTQMSRGDGTFEHADLGADGDGNTRGALFADFDGDGLFDCFLNNSPYFGIWHVSSPAPNMLLPGLAGGAFGPDILDQAVVDAPADRFKDAYGRATKCFKGVVARDFDGDGKPDIVASAFADPEGDPAGADVDLDQDGIPDGGAQHDWESGTLVLHNISGPGQIRFRDVSVEAIDNALGVPEPMRAHSTIPADIDHDGDLDLLLGAVVMGWEQEYEGGSGRVYRNDSGLRVCVPSARPFSDGTAGAGCA